MYPVAVCLTVTTSQTVGLSFLNTMYVTYIWLALVDVCAYYISEATGQFGSLYHTATVVKSLTLCADM
jgi:hypothetical protein